MKLSELCESFTQTLIRKPNGKLIGLIRNINNTRIEARKPDGTLLGWYCPVSHQTRLANGNLFALGNAVRLLLQ